MNAKIVVDAATWVVATGVAMLGVAANQDWTDRHARLVGMAAIAAVLVAALKNVPDLPGSKEVPSA